MPRKSLIQIRRGTTHQWEQADLAAATDPDRLLADGELGIDVTTGTLKVGHNSHLWSDLPQFQTLEALRSEFIDRSGLEQALANAVPLAPEGTTRPTHLPVMTISLAGGKDPEDKVNYISGNYSISTYGTATVQSGGLRLRGRGNSTWERAKKPWRINLDQSDRLLGMSANQRNWALLANALDPAKIGNALAFELGQRMSGLAWTPQYRHVELVLNGTFRGIYQLTDLVRLEAGRLPGKETTSSGDGSDGTWLLEVTNKESPANAGNTSDPGFYTSAMNQWVIFDAPEEPSDDQRRYIAAAFTAFETALSAKDWKRWSELADAESFCDWWLINELFHNHDTTDLWSSCKIHKRPDTATPGKFVMGPLWDHDLSLGYAYRSDADPRVWHTRNSSWYRALWAMPQWRDLAWQRWERLLEAAEDLGGFSLWIDRTVDALTPAIERNDQVWTLKTYPPLEADRRKRWLSTRVEWLTHQLRP